MQYYDVAGFEVSGELASRLGFSRVYLSGRDVQLLEDRMPGAGKAIVRSSNPGILAKALRSRNTVGIVISGSELLRKVVEEVRINGKLLVFVASELTAASPSDRLRNLQRMRRLLQFATHMRAEAAIISLAGGKEYLMSRMQMVEIARLIGADDGQARRMAGNMGRLDDT